MKLVEKNIAMEYGFVTELRRNETGNSSRYKEVDYRIPEDFKPNLHQEICYYYSENEETGKLEDEPCLPKDTEYFGYIIDKNNGGIQSILPDIINDPNGDGTIYYGFKYEELNDELEIPKNLPLIFKKIVNEDGTCDMAEEIITGKKFRVYDEGEAYEKLSCYDESDSTEFFQKNEKGFREYPLLIVLYEQVNLVNGAYKDLVYKEIKGHEQELRELFDKMEVRAKEKFDEAYKEQVENLKSSAYADNLIFDSKKRM